MMNWKILTRYQLSWLREMCGCEPDFSLLDERSQRFVALRLGLNGHPPQTYEQIGDSASLTRERVRQIVNKAFRVLVKAHTGLTIPHGEIP